MLTGIGGDEWTAPTWAPYYTSLLSMRATVTAERESDIEA